MISSFLLAASLLAGDAAVIVVDEVSLPAEVVTARAAEYRASGVSFADADLIRGLIEETLLALDVSRSGAATTPEVKAAVNAERTRALADALLRQEISKEIKPTEAMLRELYHSNSDTVRLTLVVVGTEAEAKAIRTRLDAGGEIELEATKSLDPVSSRKRGDTGELARAQFPKALADQLFAAQPGSLIGPTQWGPGWAVAQVVSRHVGDEAGFAAKRGALENHARTQLTEQAKAHFLKIIRDREKIVVDEKFIDSLGARIEPTGAEGSHVLATIRGTPLRYFDVLPAVRKLGSGDGSMHRSGPALKKRIISRAVDEWVLAALARERGLDRQPDVAMLMLRAEHRALARVAIEKIVASVAPSAPQQTYQKAVDDRLSKLRAKAKISIDEPRATAAIKAAP